MLRTGAAFLNDLVSDVDLPWMNSPNGLRELFYGPTRFVRPLQNCPRAHSKRRDGVRWLFGATSPATGMGLAGTHEPLFRANLFLTFFR